MNDGSFLAVTISSVVILIPVSLLILFIQKWKKRSMQRRDRTSEGQTMLYESPPMMRSSEDRSNECALTGTDQETDFTDKYTAEAANKLTKVPVELRVVFHLETTGLGMNSHILRIAAASPSKLFFRYVLPRIPIESSAENINKMSLVEGRLCKNRQPVDALTICRALSEFLEFLGDGPVTLFSHNCRKFSAPILFNAMKACNMLEKFIRKITGFVDTLYLYHNVYPGLRSYKQPDLYKHFFHKSYRAHEEMNDVTALEKLLDLPRVTPEALEMNSFGFDDIAQAVGSC